MTSGVCAEVFLGYLLEDGADERLVVVGNHIGDVVVEVPHLEVGDVEAADVVGLVGLVHDDPVALALRKLLRY